MSQWLTHFKVTCHHLLAKCLQKWPIALDCYTGTLRTQLNQWDLTGTNCLEHNVLKIRNVQIRRHRLNKMLIINTQKTWQKIWHFKCINNSRSMIHQPHTWSKRWAKCYISISYITKWKVSLHQNTVVWLDTQHLISTTKNNKKYNIQI